jgi:hypothetical protein
MARKSKSRARLVRDELYTFDLLTTLQMCTMVRRCQHEGGTRVQQRRSLSTLPRAPVLCFAFPALHMRPKLPLPIELPVPACDPKSTSDGIPRLASHPEPSERAAGCARAHRDVRGSTLPLSGCRALKRYGNRWPLDRRGNVNGQMAYLIASSVLESPTNPAIFHTPLSTCGPFSSRAPTKSSPGSCEHDLNPPD